MFIFLLVYRDSIVTSPLLFPILVIYVFSLFFPDQFAQIFKFVLLRLPNPPSRLSETVELSLGCCSCTVAFQLSLGGELEHFYCLPYLFPSLHKSFTVFEKLCFIYFVFNFSSFWKKDKSGCLYFISSWSETEVLNTIFYFITFILMSNWSMARNYRNYFTVASGSKREMEVLYNFSTLKFVLGEISIRQYFVQKQYGRNNNTEGIQRDGERE